MKTKVRVADIGRPSLVLRWIDPLSGAERQRTTGTNKRADALRQAGKLQAELNEGRYVEASRMSWAELREMYMLEKAPTQKPATVGSTLTALNAFERHYRPRRAADITAAMISTLQAKWRNENLRPATISGYLRSLKALLNWASKLGYIPKAPHIEMPKQGKGSKLMKGRPIEPEEFERICQAVKTIRGTSAVPSWHHYLRGIWWSGLRLSESLQLYWENVERLSVVDLDTEAPMLLISGEWEKGCKDRLLPIAPEFAELLRETPPEQRKGPVFDPAGYRGDRPRHDWVSKIVTACSREAGVFVGVNSRTKKKQPAGLHDFRRSFGVRWSERLLPQHLKELMRHEAIETTLKYYVGRDAKRTAGIVWNAYRDANEKQPRPNSGADNNETE